MSNPKKGRKIIKTWDFWLPLGLGTEEPLNAKTKTGTDASPTYIWTDDGDSKIQRFLSTDPGRIRKGKVEEHRTWKYPTAAARSHLHVKVPLLSLSPPHRIRKINHSQQQSVAAQTIGATHPISHLDISGDFPLFSVVSSSSAASCFRCCLTCYFSVSQFQRFHSSLTVHRTRIPKGRKNGSGGRSAWIPCVVLIIRFILGAPTYHPTHMPFAKGTRTVLARAEISFKDSGTRTQ